MISEQLQAKAQKIKLVVTDIDGVWTDAKIYYTGEGELLKAFSYYDGMGTALLTKANIRTAIITGENSEPVARRAEKLKIEDVFLGVHDKLEAFESLLEKYQLHPSEVAYIGDDLNDYNVMQVAGLTAAPSSTPAFHILKPDILLSRAGGDGAFREFADLIIASQR
ncbi:MAG: HAD-IIIA family hydrolase [FCB group bacterium]|nr:HAD-IIIA family hydrolase [FCB group bacterium]MBL7027231.1 HAD-IIIA family hydrolase [Candidatus Neomarinimicrobiota bacterium]MBL7120534.1 HAD-IIIA family hydrolase [Candidatus Neomarinimicrobiota bacterium]